MPVIKYNNSKGEKLAEGVERRLGYLKNIMIVEADLSNGPAAEMPAPHSHPHEQVGYMAEGEALIAIGNERTRLERGDIFLIPAGVPHTLQVLSRVARVIECFSPIREDFLRK